MAKPTPISLRIRVPSSLYARISEHRFSARHETRNEAMVELLAAGLAALAKPVELPAASSRPARPKLIEFAGKEEREAYGSRSRADAP